MNKIVVSSKAKTLEDLSSVVTCARILPLYRFNIGEYRNKAVELIKEAQSLFKTKVILRSSSVNEDSLITSNAGGFESIMNVDCGNSRQLQEAIQKIVDSYGEGIDNKDEIFIQPMLENVTMSGVIFTSDIDTLSSYYIVNYDESGSTDSVTSGNSNELECFICFKKNTEIKNKKLEKVIKAAAECESLLKNEFLDIEFAFSHEDLYILQARPIVTENKEDLSGIDLSKSLKKLFKKIKKLNGPHPNLLGNKTIFGVMPDWNPAEIIGIRPKRLALSLYKELITDETWAYQRDNYGYRNLRSHPLLVSFLGVPFIDVRISFNSFLPKNLDEKVSEKLVNYYLNELSKNINHHDKVEFKIIYSCFYFGLDSELSKLKSVGFSKNELESIKTALLNLTNNIIDTRKGLYKKDIGKIEILKEKYNDIVSSDLPLIDKIYWLIKDVKRYGTLPFAGIARSGFIAVQILKSLVIERIISPADYDRFLNSLNTVSKKLSRDINSLDKSSFLEIYGHLRPGTYDILSSRYDEAYSLYFGPGEDNESENDESFEFSTSQQEQINQLILKNGLKTDFKNLIIFIKESIEGRENSKFVFTRHLSQVLEYTRHFGERFNFKKEDLAFLDIQEILNLYSTLDHRDVQDILKKDIDKNRDYFRYTKAIKLPGVIVDPEDIYSFALGENEANFVTLKKIKSAVVPEEKISQSEIQGKIVCIKSADPGYDYLFSKNIGGLITCYGGANSHMAIRCAEMGIPAVIGCGENKFSKYCTAKNIEIDASNKQVVLYL